MNTIIDMNEITLKAFGKINIGLDVTGRRSDGYHLVDMIMQSVELHDVVTVKRTGSDIELSCSNPEVPDGEANLAFKAARAVLEESGIKEGVNIHIEKNIPMAAGMAGGSTDAAAVILALNELFGVGLSQEQMDRIALKLGADVPFCLRRGTWRAQGIGEVLSKLPDLPPAYVLLVAQDNIGVPTKWVYQTLDSIENPPHPDIESLLEAVYRQDIHGVALNMGNILELVTLPEYPVLTEIKDILEQAGADGRMMTGSGPTVFGIFTDRHKALNALEYFERHPALGRAILTGFSYR